LYRQSILLTNTQKDKNMRGVWSKRPYLLNEIVISRYKLALIRVNLCLVIIITAFTPLLLNYLHPGDSDAAGSLGHTITATVSGSGTINPSGTVSVPGGGNQTFTMTPNSGNQISEVLVDGSNVGAVSTYTFTYVYANHTIEAVFTASSSYNIIATAVGGGSISPSGTVPVSGGANQAFTITPNTNNQISNVLVDGTSAGAVSSYTFYSVTATHTIEADFSPITSTITATAVGSGTISPSGAVSVDDGTNQTFDISPGSGYQIADVLVDDASVGAVSSYTFNDVLTAHTIEADFSPITFTLTVSASGGGTVNPAGDVMVDDGSDQVIDATPSDGYYFSGYSSNGTVNCIPSGDDQDCTISDITSDEYFTADFAPIYTITATADGNGSISPSGSVPIDSGSTQTFNITPGSESQISEVIVDDTSVGAVTSYAFDDVTANHTIEADFSPITNTITASAGTGGSISPSGATLVNYGSDQTFNITPSSDYQISSVQVDGASVGVVNSYTFDDVVVGHTIEAGFAPITYTLTISGGPGGSVSPSGVIVVADGISQTIDLTPDDGYYVAGHSSNGSVSCTNSDKGSACTISDITSNEYFKAEFAATPVSPTPAFTITAAVSGPGTISPNGDTNVNEGANQSFAISPNSGDAISQVLVDGVDQGSITTYTFSDVTAAHSIEAIFTSPVTPITTTTTNNGASTRGSTPVVVATAAPSSNPISAVSRYVKIVFTHVPTPVAIGFPWLLLALLLLMMLWSARQAWRETSYAKKRARLLYENQQLAEAKNTFLELASHYVGTPLAKLTGGVELLESTSPSLAVLPQLKEQVNQLKAAVAQVLQKITDAKPIHAVLPETVSLKEVRNQLANKLLILSGFIGILGILIDYLLHDAKHLNTPVLVYATQAALYVFLSLGLYGAVRIYYLQHQRRTATGSQLNQQQALDSERMSFMEDIYNGLIRPYQVFSELTQTIPAGTPAGRSITSGLEGYQALCNKVKTVIDLRISNFTPAAAPANIQSIISEALQHLSPALSAKHLVINGALNIPILNALADSALLGQVFNAVLSNAVKFSPDGGAIDLYYHATHHSLSFMIKDYGKGINPDYLARLFQPFSRAQANALDFSYEGMGLSLYVAKVIMRTLHGDLNLTSASGQGTIVTIQLPMANQSAARAYIQPQLVASKIPA
jgi:signal transduction histidine kinase